ncbi:MAG TPA: hypothetical protein VGK02_00285 [Candidatus Aquicultor sp.]
MKTLYSNFSIDKKHPGSGKAGFRRAIDAEGKVYMLDFTAGRSPLEQNRAENRSIYDRKAVGFWNQERFTRSESAVGERVRRRA